MIVTVTPRQYCENPTCFGEPWCSAWQICKETRAASVKEMDYKDTAVMNEMTTTTFLQN